jgi:16S rRNA (cytidine1402-2'-O)-methyltransferase
MLYIIATPIGNLGDVSPRVLQCLRESHVIACEDTRRTRVLLTHFKIPLPPHVLSYREGNEEHAGRQILGFLRQGQTVSLCTDGGYPGVSDPGYRLVRLAVEEKQPLCVVPGASAVEIALLSSGLPTSSYTFKGFPPRKHGPLCRFFEEERGLPHTLVLFESPFRVHATLEAALEVFGDREAAVCIELTKKFERISRGYLADLVREFDGVSIKGEVTLVVAGNHSKFARQADGSRPPDDLPARADEEDA